MNVPSQAPENASSQSICKRDPRTGEVLYTFTPPDEAQLAGVMQRARGIYPVLRAMPVEQRIAETLKLRAYLIEHQHEIAQSIVRENGKCLTDALIGDVFTCIDLIDYYAANAPAILQDEKVSTPIMLMGKKSKIMYCPLGPVLVISPWNYPLNTALTPALCAFLAGNPVIIKPSEWTPMLGLLDRIIQESGFYADAFQVVCGGPDTGRLLVDLLPAKVFFTGSVRGGKEVLAQAAQHLIPVELELGGKDPMIVFEDAHLDRSARGAAWGALNNTGQGCTSVERCYVQRRVYEDFLAQLKLQCAQVRTLDLFNGGQDDGTLEMGCITTPFQYEHIVAQVEEARAMGAEVWHAYEPRPDSPVYPPTIITNVDTRMAVHTDETFGPILTLTPFETEEEVLRLANDTPYGLSASVWSADMKRAERVARQLETGNVCINDVMVSEGNSALPFGGVKQSGMGRYKGNIGLRNFCNVKAVITDKGKKRAEAHWYPYTRQKFRLFQQVLQALGHIGPRKWFNLARAGWKLDKLAADPGADPGSVNIKGSS